MNAKRKDPNPTVDHPYFDRASEPLLHSGSHANLRVGAKLDWRQGLGGGLILLGFILLFVGYIQISGTTETYDQLTYFMTGGLGGAAAIAVGATVLIIREHHEDRQAIRVLDERLSDIERRLPRDAAQAGESNGGQSNETRQNRVAASANARLHA